MTTISIAWLKKKNACFEAVEKFDRQTETNAITLIKTMMEREYRLDWANWLIVRIMTRPQYLQYAIYSAEQVIGIFEKKYPNDKRPRMAIEAVKKVLKKDTEKNRAHAANAAYAAHAAAYAAHAAAYAAHAAAHAAHAANTAAYAVAKNKMKIKILKFGIKLLEVN